MSRLFDSLAFHALALPFSPLLRSLGGPNPANINPELKRCPFIRPAPYSGLS